MIGLIQRVTKASVHSENKLLGKIDSGVLVLLGVEKDDNELIAKRLADKIMSYRIFEDEQGKMNLNLSQVNGEILVVSQFTLAAETQKGMRPSFSKGASPELAKSLYQYFCDYCQSTGTYTQTGRFGADMQVSLVNDGPVTFWLQTS